MSAQTVAVVLAAGQGTRMRSSLAKVMHPVGGLPMVSHVLNAAAHAGIASTALVVAPDAVWAGTVAGDARIFVQDNQRGTAHAVLAAREAFAGHEAVVVLFGDNPLVTGETIARVLGRVRAGVDVAVLAFEPADPAGYGRIIRDEAGQVSAIREERDASGPERAVRLCNSGIMAIRAGAALDGLTAITNANVKGEYYLTDLVGIARERGLLVGWERADPIEVMGVNDRVQLAAAEAAFQHRARTAALLSATLVAPETVHFSHDTILGRDVMVEPHVVFGPGVRVADGARIRSFSHLEGVTVAEGAVIGPYARLRPGTSIGENARIGNFVEVKAAAVDAGAKVNHLSYIGDAHIGARANVGAGTITCNYDGARKHRTDIHADAFIGSNTALVAPVSIGERAYIGSGSVITEDVPADALAIARGRQTTKLDRSPLRTRTGG